MRIYNSPSSLTANSHPLSLKEEEGVGKEDVNRSKFFKGSNMLVHMRASNQISNSPFGEMITSSFSEPYIVLIY